MTTSLAWRQHLKRSFQRAALLQRRPTKVQAPSSRSAFSPVVSSSPPIQGQMISLFSTSSSLPPIDDGAGQPGLLLSNSHYDVGGLESLMGQPIDLSDPSLQDWEQETHALLVVLIKNGYLCTDELRRHIESMPHDHYVARGYYCKWATSMALSLIERGVIDYSDLDRLLLGDGNNSLESDPIFEIGQTVRVKSERSMGRWRKPHLRSPGYIFGVAGIVDSYEGCYPDPSYKAFRSLLLPPQSAQGGVERKEHLYRVRFRQEDVWPEGKDLAGSNEDTVTVEIYENWLVDENSTAGTTTWERDPTNALQESTDNYHHHHDHDHDHDHDHEHLPRKELEQRAIDLEAAAGLCSSGSIDNDSTQPSTVVGDRLSAALIELLSQPQHLGSDLRKDLRKTIDAMESVKQRADGVTLVVKAWMDPAFEERLLKDAASAALELGINTVNATAPTKLKVVKSELPAAGQPGIHNLITCTLCSCYPLSLLGLSPKWYKSRSFRARAVREPRAMLQDSFGLELTPKEWTVRVHDSTADLRYLVLPPRPPHTEGYTEEELRKLVTRDTMIGVALPNGIL